MNQHLTTNTAFTVCVRWSQRSEYVQHYLAVSLPTVTPQGVTGFDPSTSDWCSPLPSQMLSVLYLKQVPKDFGKDRQKIPQRRGRQFPSAFISHSTVVPGNASKSSFFKTLKFNMSKVFLLHVVNDDQYLASWKEGKRYSFCDEIRNIIFSLLSFAIWEKPYHTFTKL